jgi:NADPH:quinone reductase-like Zn-dependent oxidoreductase
MVVHLAYRQPTRLTWHQVIRTIAQHGAVGDIHLELGDEPGSRRGRPAMKAVVLEQHGGLDQLKYAADFPDPKVTDGHVVIRVWATSFNHHDVFTVRGMPGIKVPLPMIIGLDMAGEVLESGPGISDWKQGDRVLVNPLNRQRGLMGEMMHGGLAEKCLVAEHQLIRMPGGVSFEQAAALPVAYGTAHRMLITHKTVKSGDKVLILGASGGVGTGCVILAKMLGAEVIACASSEDKMRRLRELGADHVIDYKKTDFSKWVVEKFGKPQRRTYEGGIDVVVNFTGGDTWAPSLKCVKRGGRILVCGATAGYDPKEDLRYIWSFELQVIGSNSFYDDNLQALMGLIAEGKMKPVIDKVLPLERAAEGLRMIENREVFGKVVVTP